LTSLVLSPAIGTFARATKEVVGKAMRRTLTPVSRFFETVVDAYQRWRGARRSVCSWCRIQRKPLRLESTENRVDRKSSPGVIAVVASTNPHAGLSHAVQRRPGRQSRFRSSQHCSQNGDRLEDAITCWHEIGEGHDGMIALRVAPSSNGTLWWLEEHRAYVGDLPMLLIVRVDGKQRPDRWTIRCRVGALARYTFQASRRRFRLPRPLAGWNGGSPDRRPFLSWLDTMTAENQSSKPVVKDAGRPPTSVISTRAGPRASAGYPCALPHSTFLGAAKRVTSRYNPMGLLFMGNRWRR
jgi:hypothetical protein